MRVLICGGTGFLGQAICTALHATGHEPIVRSRRTHPALSYSSSVTANAWAHELRNIDAVINAVGAFRDSPSQPLRALHTDGPIALFEACALAGIQRIVQVSALGVTHSATHYAHTKYAADVYLQTLHLAGKTHACIVRPSIIFGSGGGSTQLFLRLAQLPLLALPAVVRRCMIQPVAVQDVAQAIAQLLIRPEVNGVVELGGPQALTIEQLLATLRAQMGKRAAYVVTLPNWMSTMSARIGDHMPFAPWCTEALQMLTTPNVCPPETLQALLQRPALAPHQFYATLHNTPNEQ